MNDELLKKSLISLDWHRLIERLTEYAGSTLGKERIAHLEFHTARDDIQRLQDQTTEVRKLLDDGKAVPIGGIRDIRPVLESAAKGEVLVGRELMDVANTLQAAHQLKRFFVGHADRCPKVLAVATVTHDLQELSALLLNSFDTSGELSSQLYPQLAQLRARIHSMHGRIKDRLGNMLSSADFSSLAQDQYVTMRGDRYVIPLKVQARSMDLGIVHDTSGSGQTVFVEPRQIIPLNNELKMTEAEFRREERRILTELSRKVSLESPRISDNLTVVAELELIHARACLSRDLDAVQPVLTKGHKLVLRQARHPVLVLRGVKVIPNDLSIGADFQALILSGPNTGGKTVSMKLLGLCALMTRVGLHIPAMEGSEVGIFTRIYTDIGDQQTVEQDLSTFSGHIVGIRKVLEDIGEDGSDALVLLDEIAVGTDPAQGAALARAILEAFVDRGAKLIVTTHYAELKTLSVQDKRFANGRVEYDSVGLRPTYRMVIGTPGRSYALDIAEKLGIRHDLIQQARGYLASGQRALEDLLSELEASLSDARDQRTLADRARKEADSLKERYEARLLEVERESQRLREKALARFESEVRSAREDIAKVVGELKKEKGKGLVTSAEAKRKITEVVQKVREHAPKTTTDPLQGSKPIALDQLKVGLKVLVVSLKREGQVVSLPVEGGLVEIQVGPLRAKVWPDDLRHPMPGLLNALQQPKGKLERQADRGARRANERDFTVSGVSVSYADDDEHLQTEEGLEHAFQTSRNTLDLRGVRVDEGLAEVERFLDRASLANEPYVFVIHGHGTGAMKHAVRDYLKTCPYARRFQAGSNGQGGDGATVVALR